MSMLWLGLGVFVTALISVRVLNYAGFDDAPWMVLCAGVLALGALAARAFFR
jgi:hypothetical protein